MALALADLRRRDELLNRLKTAWDNLSSEERSAVEVIVNSIVLNHAAEETDEALFSPLTETELFDRIDCSLSQADRGEYLAADVFEKEVEAEFGVI